MKQKRHAHTDGQTPICPCEGRASRRASRCVVPPCDALAKGWVRFAGVVPEEALAVLVWCEKQLREQRESRLSIEGEDDARPLLLIPDNNNKGGQEICRKLRQATRTVLASLTEALRLRYPGCRLYSQLQVQNFTTLKGSPITVSISPWDSAGEQGPHAPHNV